MINQYFKNKSILVTGGTGSIGSEIVKNLLLYKPKLVIILSNDENGMFYAIQKYGVQHNIRYAIGDVRDKDKMFNIMKDVNIVIHTAALKHVPLCEYNPFEAIKTNVIGTHNIIEGAIYNNVEKLINISTDKAVNPINTMGATKLLTEKLIEDANIRSDNTKTISSNIRFGNVLFSRGSVIPLFIEQIKKYNYITLTNPDMTRFFMSIKDTTKLIFKAIEQTERGELFILKMPTIRMGDLADVIIELYGNKDTKIKIIGIRDSEKMNESLITKEERKVAKEEKDLYIIPYTHSRLAESYKNVEDITINTLCINKERIKELLESYKL